MSTIGTAQDAHGGRILYTYDALERLTRVCYANCAPTGGGGAGGGGAASVGITASSGLDCTKCGGSGAVPDRAPEDNPPAPSDTFTAWTYDPLGNRLAETDYLGTKTSTYDAADRLVSVRLPDGTSTAYTYDRNGNQLSAGPSASTYDLADRLTSATVGGTSETYTWSGDGVRLSAATGPQASKTTQFVVDRAFDLPTVALERDGNGKLVRRYAYGLDLLAQTTPTKGPYWSHHDGLGSVTDVTSATGASLWWAEYSPFGAPRASASTSQAPVNLFRFSGEYLDLVTALYHLRARQYDPSLGRFLSPDPVSPSLSSPSVGAYVYVRNSPINLVDPSGLESQPASQSEIGVRCTAAYLAGSAVNVVAFRAEVAILQAHLAAGAALPVQGALAIGDIAFVLIEAGLFVIHQAACG